MGKAKKSNKLERWIAMDRALASKEGMDLKRFAKRYRVSERTVFRDLAAFEELGRTHSVEPFPEMQSWRDSPSAETEARYGYDPGVKPLFTDNQS